MLISNTIISDISSTQDRAKYLGYVSTGNSYCGRFVFPSDDPLAASIGYIIGPALGGIASEMFGKNFPVFVACFLFAGDFVLVLFFLPESSSSLNSSKMPESEVSDPLKLPPPIISSPLQESWATLKEMVRQTIQSASLMYLLAIQFFASLVRLLNQRVGFFHSN